MWYDGELVPERREGKRSNIDAVDPDAALQGTNQRFIQRLSHVETLAGRPLTDYSLEELETLWQRAKAQLNRSDNLP